MNWYVQPDFYIKTGEQVTILLPGNEMADILAEGIEEYLRRFDPNGYVDDFIDESPYEDYIDDVDPYGEDIRDDSDLVPENKAEAEERCGSCECCLYS